MTLDPESIEADRLTAEYLRATAALAGEFWDALRLTGIPEAASIQILTDWHYEYITDGVAWRDDTSGED